MQKICKEILDYMIDQNKGCAFEIFYSDTGINKMSADIKFPLADVCAASEYLISSGYLSPIITDTGLTRGFHLSHKGLYYKAFRANSILSFIVESVLVPIAVAFVTTLITSALLM